MKYSYNWIQKHIEEKLPTSEALAKTIHDHAFEVESTEQKGDDTIFDIAVLPDRAGDCLSHYGMAREIAGLLKLTFKPVGTASLPQVDLKLPVEIKSDICCRYIAIAVDGVRVGPSPAWLKDALESIGQRSINNVVDATNYLLNDLGQPVHAFDAAKIDGGIVVRAAHEGETIITLSDEEKKLTPDMCVITDYLGSLAIAGVKGGKSAEVSESTTSIVIEVASFDATSIRKTARSLNLQTDASKRFENNLSPEVAGPAAAAVVALIKDIAGGEVVGVKDVYSKPQEVKTISFTVMDIARILGSHVTGRMIGDVFDCYGYTYMFDDGVFTLTIPSHRQDISSTADIAEEVGRVVGYEQVAQKSLPLTPSVVPNDIFESIRAVRAYLLGQGFSEVMNYTFVKKGDIYIAHGPKDKSALRTNLSDALKESYEKNRLNAPLLDLAKVKIFEIGTVFNLEGDTMKESIHVAMCDAGTVQELSLEEYIKINSVSATSIDYRLLTNNPFKPWSQYPFIARDIAVWVSDEAGKEKLLTMVADFAQKYCVKAPYKFDEFSKDDRTSIAYRFVFQSYDHTLTETEVERWWQELVKEIKKESGCEIR